MNIKVISLLVAACVLILGIAPVSHAIGSINLSGPVTAGANNLNAGYNGFQNPVDVFG